MAAHLHGIHVDLLTPFTAGGEVDDAAFAQLVDDQLRAGVEGLLVAGGTGEGLLLSPQEVDVLLELAVDAAAGRVPVTVQISALSTRDAVTNADRALAGGAAIGLLAPPHSEPIGPDELVGHYAAVAETGLPIMIYNNPGTGIPLPPELVARLADIDGVHYLKDSTSEPDRLSDIANLTAGSLQILHGKDSLALLGFLNGTRASVWGAANATPRACVRLYELAVTEQDLVSARRLWQLLYPVMRFFEQQGYVAALKAATARRGLAVGDPRLPLLPLSDGKRAHLHVLLDALDAATAEPTPFPEASR